MNQKVLSVFLLLLIELLPIACVEKVEKNPLITLRTRGGAEFSGVIASRDSAGVQFLQLPDSTNVFFGYSELAFDSTKYFQQGRAPVKILGKWGFIDKSGQVVVPPRYEQAGRFSDGLAQVKLNGQWGYLDTTYHYLIEPDLKFAGVFYEGRAIIYGRSYDLAKNVYLLDVHGKRLNALTRYKEWAMPAGGRIGVKRGRKWGFLNLEGEVVIKPTYKYVTEFSEGLAGVRVDQSWKYIDTLGNVVLETQAIAGKQFSEGYALPLSRYIVFQQRDSD